MLARIFVHGVGSEDQDDSGMPLGVIQEGPPLIYRWEVFATGRKQSGFPTIEEAITSLLVEVGLAV